MKCPSCNKFATYDLGAEPELDIDIENGVVTGTVRIVLTSECCGDELKEATFDVEIDLAKELEDELRDALNLPNDAEIDLSDDDIEVSITEESASLTDRRESTSRHTKKDGTVVERPIPFRYQKQYYGALVEVTVQASKGDTTVTVAGKYEDETQASGMEELV